MGDNGPVSADWDVVIPLKPTARGKSRLGLDATQRQALSLAFLLDLLGAVTPARDIASITVVGDPADADRLPPGVSMHPDPGRGLNEALVSALAQATSPWTLILMGDLPCATTSLVEQLVVAMRPLLVAGGPSAQAFLCDQPGVGSTALGGPAGAVRPRFGKRSRAAHRLDGATEITDLQFARLRRDVDSMPDLADALRLDVGPNTRRVCAEFELGPITSKA